MFVWKEKKHQKDELSKVMDIDSSWRGSNRRAISLVPFPYTKYCERQVAQASKVRYQQLLISMEGKQSTTCLKVVSPKKKSRGALLVFRGKAIGCVYGKKDLSNQLLGQEAYKYFLDDLSTPDSIVDHYILPEELALAAAALFHGDVFRQPHNLTPRRTFEYAYAHFVETELPGCIVIRHDDGRGVLAFIYFFAGRVVGVFTFSDGWLSDSQLQCLSILDRESQIEVSASKLLAFNVWEVNNLAFSLTGLSEVPVTQPKVLHPIDFLI